METETVVAEFVRVIFIEPDASGLVVAVSFTTYFVAVVYTGLFNYEPSVSLTPLNKKKGFYRYTIVSQYHQVMNIVIWKSRSKEC